MTSQKPFKTRVRARMEKTGESYTTARRQLLAKHEPAAQVEPAPAGTTPPARARQLADAGVRERTGHGVEHWFALLDGWGATERSHAEIARWLNTQQDIDSWWSQSITVAYEHARGMREPGQQTNGRFSTTASRTIEVPVERLFAAFTDPEVRERWLPGEKVTVTTVTAPKSYRAAWGDDSSRIAVGFVPKGDTRAQVALQHGQLADAASAAATKEFWRARFAALKVLLET